jgi:5-methyltetrahydropteroyltriglutamate--homocysteine methyltransferase
VELSASLTGSFPRPESVVTLTRDLDRGRATADQVEAGYRSAEADVLRIEAEHHLSPRTGGYLRWPDLFRPFASGWPGFEVGPLTRWFETNTFFRQPILKHPPERTPGAIARWLPAANSALPAAEARAILPGPYTFAGLLDNESGETFPSLVYRLGRLLAEEVRELRGLGYASFQYQEPLLVVRPPEGPAAESVRAAYGALGEAAGPASTALWSFFGDAAPVFPLLTSLPVGLVGVDLADTVPDELAAPAGPFGLGFGCIDPRTTLLEDPAELARLVEATVTRLQPTRVHLGPGAPLDLLPYAPATRKLGVLFAARERLGAGRTP